MSVYYEGQLAYSQRLKYEKKIENLRAQRDKLLEACEEGIITLKLALATIDGACGIPKERRKPSPTVLEMEEVIAAVREKP